MNMILNYLKRFVCAIAMPLGLYIFLLIVAPDRVQAKVLMSMLQQAIIPAILAYGVIFELKVGIWDFSVGATVVFSSIVGGNIALNLGFGNLGIVVCILIVAVLTGLFTGTLFALMKIPSIIVSVGVMLVLESLSSVVFGGGGVVFSYSIMKLAAFPYNFILGIIAFVIFYYLYNVRTFGYQVRAIGKGISVAKFQGLKVDKVRLLCFVTTSLFAGLYAVITVSGSAVSKPVTNMGTMGVVFNAIICGMIAQSLEKYVNVAIGIYIGAVTTKLINLAVLVLGVPGTFQNVIVAFVLLIFLALDMDPALKQQYKLMLMRKFKKAK